MRKIIFGLMIAFISFNLNGQRLNFSVYADPQFSWFSSDEKEIKPNGSVFHLNTGLELNYYFQPNYAFFVGLGINNMGGNLVSGDTTYLQSKEETLTVNPDFNLRHRLQYVNLPFGLKLKTEELGYLTFSFQAGLNPMFNISAHTTSDNQILDRETIRESVNLFNLHYFVGANAKYRLGGRTSVIGGLRWSSGFTDVTDYDKANISLNALSVHIGILF
ncbi:MAG TPA: PorT family protein [Candidatus Marinimicrobia bacterium]|nr:PorT family protein [Candidatus Neomarinimicrobiota bacterium]